MLIDQPTFRRLVRARELLADDELSVRQIAERVKLSPYHFIRVFGTVFGDSPHQFRMRVRIDRAKQLLSRGASVTETCIEVGYGSVGSFSALFTRWAGVAPSAYRRSIAVPKPISAPISCIALLEQFWRSAPASAWA